jgi:hypothetical protein
VLIYRHHALNAHLPLPRTQCLSTATTHSMLIYRHHALNAPLSSTTHSMLIYRHHALNALLSSITHSMLFYPPSRTQCSSVLHYQHNSPHPLHLQPQAFVSAHWKTLEGWPCAACQPSPVFTHTHAAKQLCTEDAHCLICTYKQGGNFTACQPLPVHTYMRTPTHPPTHTCTHTCIHKHKHTPHKRNSSLAVRQLRITCFLCTS